MYPSLRDVYICMPPDTRGRLAPQLLIPSETRRNGCSSCTEHQYCDALYDRSARRLASACRVPQKKVSGPRPEDVMDVPAMTRSDHLLACTFCTSDHTTVPRLCHHSRFALHLIYRAHTTLLDHTSPERTRPDPTRPDPITRNPTRPDPTPAKPTPPHWTRPASTPPHPIPPDPTPPHAAPRHPRHPTPRHRRKPGAG